MCLRETHAVFLFCQTNISQGCVDIRAVAHCSQILMVIFLSIYFSLFLTCWSSRGWCCIIPPLHGCRTCPAIRRWDCRPIPSSHAIRDSISHRDTLPATVTFFEPQLHAVTLSYCYKHWFSPNWLACDQMSWSRGSAFPRSYILAVKLSHRLFRTTFESERSSGQCLAQQASCCLCDFFLQHVPLETLSLWTGSTDIATNLSLTSSIDRRPQSPKFILFALFIACFLSSAELLLDFNLLSIKSVLQRRKSRWSGEGFWPLYDIEIFVRQRYPYLKADRPN